MARHAARSAEEWKADTGTPDEDIIANLPLLRARSRDLFMGAPVAAAAVLTLRTNVVGSGLVPMPTIDGEVLGKTTRVREGQQVHRR